MGCTPGSPTPAFRNFWAKTDQRLNVICSLYVCIRRVRSFFLDYSMSGTTISLIVSVQFTYEHGRS